MEFFNRKEEVLEVQLTQEGKRLLSMGKFVPFYYEIFDDDILYETNGSGFQEEQNYSVPRIKETPRIKTQAIVYGIETDFKKLIPNAKQKKYLYNKNHDSLKYPLGLGDFSRNYMPSWDLKLNSGIIQTGSFSMMYSPESDYYEKIPQINCTCSYFYEGYVIQNEKDQERYDTQEEYQTPDNTIFYKSNIFDDKTYYVIREQNNIFAVLKEYNATFDKENFDIEVFEVEKTDGEKEEIKNLLFTTIEPSEYENLEIELTSTDVEWFFSIAKDENIVIGGTQPQFNIYIDESAKNSEEPC